MNQEFEWKLRWGPPTRGSQEVVLVDAEKYDSGFPQARTVHDFIDWLEDLENEVPEEFRGSLEIELESTGGYEGSHYARIRIFYRRPETDEEFGARVTEYETALRSKQEYERSEFERLKKQFET